MTESSVRSASDHRSRPRKRSRATMVVAVVAIVLVAIGVVGATQFSSGTFSSHDLSIGLIAEPEDLDVRSTEGVPLDQILIDNVYQGLVGLKPGSVDEIVPVLATDLPRVSADGLTYTFTLRDDVTFHSGERLTADDVVSSLRETLTPDLIGSETTVSQVGDAQVRIELASPNRQLLWHLSNRAGLILQADANNDLATSTNGTGPFTVEEWNAGERVVLAAREEYWGPATALDSVTFHFISDGRRAVRELHDGKLDVHMALLPSLRSEFIHSDEFTMVRAKGTDVFTLAFNSAHEPLNDPRIRTALSLAIDSEAIIKAQNGDGQALGGPITELEPGYEDLTSLNTYNPDAARDLLVEAGQPNLSLTLTTPNMYDTAALDLITSQLKEVGVAVKIKTVEFVTWLEEVHENHDYQLSYVDQARARDFGNYADPEYYFEYDNARVQALYADSLAAPTAEDENRLLAEAARQIAEDAPAKWLYNYTPTNVVGNHVEGFPEANTNARINLEGVRTS